MPAKSVKSTDSKTEKVKQTKKQQKEESESEHSETEHSEQSDTEIVVEKKTKAKQTKVKETKAKKTTKAKQKEPEPEPEPESEQEPEMKQESKTEKNDNVSENESDNESENDNNGNVEQEWHAQLSDDDKKHSEPVSHNQTSTYKSKRFDNLNAKSGKIKPELSRSTFSRPFRVTCNGSPTPNNKTESQDTTQYKRQDYRESREPRESREHSNHKVNVNKVSKALKFSYNDYDHVVNPVHEVSSEDLIRVVVARSYKEGQMSLKRCLENVLRAMNHECNFPTLPTNRPHFNKHKEKEQAVLE